MPSKEYLEQLGTHGRNLTEVIKGARKSNPELAEKLDTEWGGFLQAMSDCLEDMRISRMDKMGLVYPLSTLAKREDRIRRARYW